MEKIKVFSDYVSNDFISYKCLFCNMRRVHDNEDVELSKDYFEKYIMTGKNIRTNTKVTHCSNQGCPHNVIIEINKETLFLTNKEINYLIEDNV